MFTAQMHATTTMAGITYQVVDIMTGRSLLTTRRPEVAVTVAARCNSGDTTVRASDFSS